MVFAVAGSAAAQDGDSQALAQKLSNPVASLISVPFQENFDFGLGPVAGDGNAGVRSTLNIQPVVPLEISGEWNLILRTILPVIYQDDVSASGASESGVGDVLQSFFFSPRKPGPGGLIWGVGPAALYPTASDEALGGDKWGLGPTVVALKQQGPHTYGVLANHIWSIAGEGSASDVSSTFVQPFYAYATRGGATFSINSETSYDWKRGQWTVPVNVVVAHLLKVGEQPVQVGMGARYYLEKPRGGPEWGLRFVVTLLYPK